MQSVDGVETSASEIRTRALFAGKQMAGAVQISADSAIIVATPLAATAVARWRSNIIPSIQEAALLSDPLMAVLDLWALGIQNEDFVRQHGDTFGDARPILERSSTTIVRIAETLKDRVVQSNDFSFNETALHLWAGEHPITDLTFVRESVVGSRADMLGSNGRGALASVATMEQTLEGLNARLSFTNEYLLKQVEWKTELAAQRLAKAFEENLVKVKWENRLDSLHSLALRLPGFAASERSLVLEWLTNERQAALNEINSQRIETLDLMLAQQSFVEDLLASERQSVVRAMQEERLATFDDLEKLMDSQIATVESMLNRILVKVLLMTLGLLLLAGMVLWAVAGRYKK